MMNSKFTYINVEFTLKHQISSQRLSYIQNIYYKCVDILNPASVLCFIMCESERTHQHTIIALERYFLSLVTSLVVLSPISLGHSHCVCGMKCSVNLCACVCVCVCVSTSRNKVTYQNCKYLEETQTALSLFSINNIQLGTELCRFHYVIKG